MTYSVSSAEQVRATRLLLQQRQAEAAQIEQQREAAQLAVQQLQEQLSQVNKHSEQYLEQEHAAAASTQSAQHSGHTPSQHSAVVTVVTPPHSTAAQNSNRLAAAASGQAEAAQIITAHSMLAAPIDITPRALSDSADMQIDAASAGHSSDVQPQSSPLRRISHTQQHAVAISSRPSHAVCCVCVCLRAFDSCVRERGDARGRGRRGAAAADGEH